MGLLTLPVWVPAQQHLICFVISMPTVDGSNWGTKTNNATGCVGLGAQFVTMTQCLFDTHCLILHTPTTSYKLAYSRFSLCFGVDCVAVLALAS